MKNPLEYLADGLVAWRSRQSAPLHARAERVEFEVAQLSLQQARLQARALLEGGGTFDVSARRPEASAEEVPAGISPLVIELLSDFPSIEARYGDQKLGPQYFGASSIDSDFIRIGLDMGAAEVAVRPGDDGIFVLHPEEDPARESPSIYHWLVLLARLVEPHDGE